MSKLNVIKPKDNRRIYMLHLQCWIYDGYENEVYNFRCSNCLYWIAAFIDISSICI